MCRHIGVCESRLRQPARLILCHPMPHRCGTALGRFTVRYQPVLGFSSPAWFFTGRVAFIPPSRNGLLHQDATTFRPTLDSRRGGSGDDGGDSRRDSSRRQLSDFVQFSSLFDGDGDEGESGRGLEADSAWCNSDWTVDDSPDKWEKAWLEGEKEKREPGFWSSMAGWDKQSSGRGGKVETNYARPVEIVSFDLDNTLWATRGVIDAANSALQAHLEREHPAVPKKPLIADLMKDIWQERMAADPTLDPAPLKLTELRKAALTRACELAKTDPSVVVDSTFEVWRRVRHNIEPYLFPGVLETLKTLKDRGIRLIAITNGNADTDDIPCLRNFFEFCIIAERVGERKPDAGPFRMALQLAGYLGEENVGGEWVHVGDEWSSDCVGAKTMRMRTILVPPPGSKEQAEEEVKKKDDAPLTLDRDEDEEKRKAKAWQEDIANKFGAIDVGDKESAAAAAGIVGPDAMRAAEEVGLMVEGMVDTSELPPSGIPMPERLKELKEEASAAAEIQTESMDLNRIDNDKLDNGAIASAGVVVGDSDETVAVENPVVGGGSGGGYDAVSTNGRRPAIPPGATYYDDLHGEGTTITNMDSGDYIAEMLKKDFMDEEVGKILDVVVIVDRWNEQYAEYTKRITAATAALGATPAQNVDATGNSRDTKFCIECGNRIAAVAKFCPECGTKQEAIAP